MITAEELAEHQADAESFMTLTLSWFEPGGTVMNDDMEVDGFTARGTTPGKVQAISRQGGDTTSRTVDVGGTDRLVIEAGVHIPVGALFVAGQLTLAAGWECEVTAITAGLDDPALMGRRYQVVDWPPAKSRLTARRLNVVEV